MRKFMTWVGALIVATAAGLVVLHGPAAWGTASPTPKARGSLTVDQFKALHLNKFEDYDGSWGAQCVDLYKYYNVEVVGSTSEPVPGDGSAYNLWTNETATMKRYYVRVGAGKPAQKGDVAVWGTGISQSGHGHVAIVLADEGRTLEVLSENTNGMNDAGVDSKGGQTRDVKGFTKSSLLGYLRPIKLSSNPSVAVDALISESAGKVRVRGWAADPNTAGAIRVDVRVSASGVPSTLIGSATANKAYAGHGNHGFDATFAHPVKAGSSVVSVTAINVGAGANVTWRGVIALSASCGRVGTMMRNSAGTTWLVRYDCKKHLVSAGSRADVSGAGVRTYAVPDSYANSWTTGLPAEVSRIDDPTRKGPAASIHYVKSADGYAGDYFWTQWDSTAKPGNWAVWTHKVPAGVATVRVYIPANNALATVRYRIYDGSTLRCDVAVNQAKHAGWISLCDTEFSTGNAVVNLPDNAGTGPKWAHIGWDATSVVPTR